MGMGLCVAFIAFVRLPSLKVSTLLLTGLLIYDVFWVFFSSYIFNANVMVKVRFDNEGETQTDQKYVEASVGLTVHVSRVQISYPTGNEFAFTSDMVKHCHV